ncbi:MAG: hypothetical protein JW757_06005 [Anaerolineales bacterium]|nr:hypothetical protein [Anaerolineales bacterium]
MIRSFLEMMMGEVGRQILYFYEANACVINSVVLSYGLFMFLCWNNLVRVYRYLVVEVAKTVHLNEDLNRKSTNKRVREMINIPWEKAVEAAPFPFVGHVGALLPKRISVETLQLYFDDKEIVDLAIKLLKGAHIKTITPSSRKLGARLREQKNAERKAEKEEAQE